MVGIKKSQRKQGNTNRKKLCILGIIIILISTVFPLMGITKIPTQDPHLTIDSFTTITEQVQTNTQIETRTTATSWWNTNWHYRRIYNIIGVGNISLPMNFTALLQTLQVMNRTFDNSTITIVRYHSNETMVVVNKTWFNESTHFHNRTNAVGTLAWNVSGAALYGVYFDVHENRGTRNHVVETPTLIPSGSLHPTVISTQGWNSTFKTEFEPYYGINESIPIAVSTTALAKNVTAQFIFKEHPKFNLTLSTFDNLLWTTTKKLTEIGDWTIQVNAIDDAGYQPTPLIVKFYIGKPDLIASALSAPDYCYINTNVSITANIRAINTTVKHVNASLRVDNNNISNKTDLTIQINENKTIQFYWIPQTKGKHNVSFQIFYSDSNPNNNKRWKNVSVEGIPDLIVQNITVSPTPVNEGNQVAVTAYLKNKGDGNAINYEIGLFCEQNENNHTMKYLNIKNSTIFNCTKNTTTNVTLYWGYTRYGKANFNGEWAVGIKIFNTTQTPDKNLSNNEKPLYHVLKVIPAERIPPLLTNLEYPSSLELGDQLLIRVKATDASGIDTVSISIKAPNKTYVNSTMVVKENDRYEYLYTPIQLGRYNFTIKATDLSPNKNQSNITGFFTVTGDQTPPDVTYYGVNPMIQLPNRPVEIRCITTDYSGIKSVELTIQSPDNQVETHGMSTPPADTKYVYTKTYESIGKYVFSITVEDTVGNQQTTDEKTFWITDDLDDTDSDGMPDDWEERYGLNPYDSNDASQDEDTDGVTNLEEYQQGTNPLKKLSSSSEIFDRLQENWAYLTASLIVFVVIILLAMYGIRRRTK